MDFRDYDSKYLAHHGVMGMHWGIRRYQPYRDGDGQAGKGKEVGEAAQIKEAAKQARKTGTGLKAPSYASKKTKRVVSDFNNKTDAAFKRRYGVSKSKYAKKVEKYGDPYIRRINGKPNKYMDYKGKLTDEGKEKYGTKPVYLTEKQLEKGRNIALAMGGLAVGMIAGPKMYRYGLLHANKILKAGTELQNIAPTSRTFDTSFYAVNLKDKRDPKFFLKQFSQNPSWFNPEGRTKRTVLRNDERVKIAGKTEMNKAYNKVVKKPEGKLGKYGIMTKEEREARDQWMHKFGGLTEEERTPFMNELKKKGYGGFKDYNDMTINWGNTPMVLFGKDSGFKPVRSGQIDVNRAKQLKVPVKNTRYQTAKNIEVNMESPSMYVGAAAGSTGLSNYAERKRYQYSMNRYGKPYKQLTSSQKKTVDNNWAFDKKYKEK